MTNTENKLQEIWKEVFKQDTIDLNKSFLELGGKSLMIFSLMKEIKKEFEYSIELELFFEDSHSSINSIAKRITKHKKTSLNDDFAFFKKNGFLGPFKLKTPEEMAEIWKKVRVKLLRSENSVFPGSKLNYDRHLDIEEIKNIVQSEKVVNKLKNIVSDSIKCWRTEWFPKYPGDEGTEWHQSKNFFEFDGDPKVVPTISSPEIWGCTVWDAFTDATLENGCLKLIPGSQEKFHFDESKAIDYDPDIINNKIIEDERKGFFGYDWDLLKKDPNWKPKEESAMDVEMKAGEFFIFTPQVLHGSLPNTSKDDTRFGMAIRYVSDDVEVYPGIQEFNFKGERLKLDKYKTLSV